MPVQFQRSRAGSIAQGVNTANVLGGDDLTEDMAYEALRDEANMFDRADHSVPLSSCDLGVNDLIMLPVRAPHPRATSAITA